MSQCWFRWPDSMPNGPQRECDYPVVGMRDGHPCCAMHAERKVPEEMGNTDEFLVKACNISTAAWTDARGAS